MNIQNETIFLEGMTSISSLLNTNPSVNDRNILRVLIDRSVASKKYAEIAYLQHQSKERGFLIEMTDSASIERLASGKTHGGILAECSRRTIPFLSVDKIKPASFYAYLEGMEDPYNFGSSLRSLYAAGVSGIVLPERNWMNAAGTVARSSAGASERLPTFISDPETTIEIFHQLQYTILCAGIRNSVSIFENTFQYPILLVIGGEKRGISKIFNQKSDQIVRIDYGREYKGSLSSAASAAVIAFELLRQNKK